LNECYVLLGIPPSASTEEIEKAYADKKREIEPDRLKELDAAYNEAIMATFAPVKGSAVSSLSIDKRQEQENTAGKAGGKADEIPAALPDNRLLYMDAGQLEEDYDPFKNEPLFLTWGIRNTLLRRYVMIYAAFVILGLLIFALGGPPYPNEVIGAAANLDAGAPMVAPMVPTVLAVLMVFVATGYYFLCALPVPIIIRFMLMGEPLRGIMIYMFSVLSALVLYTATAWLLGDWAGSHPMLAFVSAILCAVTIMYEES